MKGRNGLDPWIMRAFSPSPAEFLSSPACDAAPAVANPNSPRMACSRVGGTGGIDARWIDVNAEPVLPSDALGNGC